MRKITERGDIINTGNSSVSETVVMDADGAFKGQSLSQLEASTRGEVRDITTKSPSYLLRQVLEHVLPLITVFINGPSVESRVPLCFKKANVRPLLKKGKFE